MEVELVKELPAQQMEWRNDPQIMRWCRQNKILTQADQDRWLKWIKEDPSVEMFGIKAGEDLVGTCGLTSIRNAYPEDHKTAEYSLLIGPPYQGQGYAKKALIKLLKYGFEYLDLIWGEIYEHNVVGRIIASKVGFVEEAMLRSRYIKDGKRINSIIVSITKKEFECFGPL